MNWFLRKEDGTVYGPVPLTALRQWSTEGRIDPTDSIRAEGQPIWTAAPEFPDLEMDWLVQLEDGSMYGPLNLLSFHDLVADGSIPPQARIIHKKTKETRALPAAWGKPATAAPHAPAKPEPLTAAPIAPRAPAKPQPLTAAPIAPRMPAKAEPVTAPVVQQAAAPRPAPTGLVQTLPAGIAGAQNRQEWKAVAESRDAFEKDSLKWKKMYEDEHASALQREAALNERVEELRKSELAVRMQLEQAQRKASQVEGSYTRIKEALETKSGDGRAAQLAAVMESYNELSQRYDSLLQQLAERSKEIQSLLQSRGEAERTAEAQIKRMEEIVHREREEADNARRRVAEMEETHLQLVKVYRELNERYIRSRDVQSGGATPAARPPKE